jgi:hypothetical protein
LDKQGLLQFANGRIKTLTLTPNDRKNVTASLTLSGSLTPELAEKMRCKEAVFRPDGHPHSSVTRLDLGGAILRDIDFDLPSMTMPGGFDRFRPEDIGSFRVDVDGMLVRISMLVRIKGRYLELVDFVEKQNTDEFEFAVRSLQEEFDWNGAGGAGDRVEMSSGASGKKENQGPLFQQPTCVHCDREVPRNYTGHHMVGDELVACPRPLVATLTDEPEASNEGEKEEASNEPALPAIHVVGSGRGPKQRNRRQPEIPTAEEIEDSVTVQ